MDNVIRNVGPCLVETKRKDFGEAVKKFSEFVHTSQFSQQPKHVEEVGGILSDSFRIFTGEILYGVEQDGSLTWLGQIIDSSD